MSPGGACLQPDCCAVEGGFSCPPFRPHWLTKSFLLWFRGHLLSGFYVTTIVNRYLFSCSNCPSLGHGEPFQAGCCAASTRPSFPPQGPLNSHGAFLPPATSPGSLGSVSRQVAFRYQDLGAECAHCSWASHGGHVWGCMYTCAHPRAHTYVESHLRLRPCVDADNCVFRLQPLRQASTAGSSRPSFSPSRFSASATRLLPRPRQTQFIAFLTLSSPDAAQVPSGSFGLLWCQTPKCPPAPAPCVGCHTVRSSADREGVWQETWD